MSQIRTTSKGVTYVKVTKSIPSLEEHKNDVQTIIEHYGDKKHLFVMNFKHVQPNTNKEIRDFMTSEDYINITQAVAWLVNDSVGKMMGKLITSFTKPPYPFEVFSIEKEAMAWLLAQEK